MRIPDVLEGVAHGVRCLVDDYSWADVSGAPDLGRSAQGERCTWYL